MSGHVDANDKTYFGFWVYLLTDFVMFATLFATYVVLQYGTSGGPSGRELFHLNATLVQTVLLLLASFTAGLATSEMHQGNARKTIVLFCITFLLGIGFMIMEGMECQRLVASGASWHKSAYLSAFFTLIATHGVHMVFALLFVPVFLIPVCFQGLTSTSIRRLTCLRMFWQFLNVVWVFIFTIVYLMGSV